MPLLLWVMPKTVNEDEFLPFYNLYGEKNPNFPYASYPQFDLQHMKDSECVAKFWVHKRDIPALADALQIHSPSVCEGIEKLCMLLRRVSYPCRYGDMMQCFSRPVLVLSMITNTVLAYIYDLHGYRISHWNNAGLRPPQLQGYADVRVWHSTGKLLWFYRWHHASNMSPWEKPESGL